MASFIIEGGNRIEGSIVPQGAKNEALEVLCGVLLTSSEVRISNVPEILDVLHLIDILRNLGVKVERKGKGDYVMQADEVDLTYMQTAEYGEACARLRGAVMLSGPLLARFGEAVMPRPGGDKIGRRRLDVHLQGLADLGGDLSFDEVGHCYRIRTKEGGLKGRYMHLREASITGTANIIMAAVLAQGTTTIYNAACEPYIQGLCRMLISMGAKIQGVSSNLLTIEGVSSLGGTHHRVSADMIEVGSFIGMSAVLGGGLTIEGADASTLGLIPGTFRKMGVKLRCLEDKIVVPYQSSYEIETFMDGSFLTIDDAPWPGLTPDLISVLIVVATQAKGSVLFHQKMFESRLFFVDRLIEMGAQIVLCDPHRAFVVGHNHKIRLRAHRMTSPDIRAGIALLIAALSAEGVSRIDNVGQIDRGYESIDERLNVLGAKIIRQ